MSSFHSVCLISTAFFALSACGGGTSRPGPLKHHFDDMYIAQVPIEEKRSVLDAQQDWSIAKMHLAKARQDYESALADVKVAENEVEMAKFEVKSANERQKVAEKSGDLTKINQATLLVHAAKLNSKAAKKKTAYLRSYRKYLKAKVDLAEDRMYEQEARFEMSKSSMAQRKNIQPRGFSPKAYQKQSRSRAKYVERTKKRVDKAKVRADKVKSDWQKLRREAKQAAQSAGAPVPKAKPVPSTTPGSSGSGQSRGSGDSGDSSGSSGTTTTEPINASGGGQ